jgi:hypothetical protein
MNEEKRIYVVIPAAVQVPADIGSVKTRYVLQPAGRQIAQACHVVSKLRNEVWSLTDGKCPVFYPVTTIILQGRDSEELFHVLKMLHKKRLKPAFFSDENEAAYGRFKPVTALAVFATPRQVEGILDYLPLWGS